MTLVLEVDPVGYVAASVQFALDVAMPVTDAYHALESSLSGTGESAGHDVSGQKWGASYDATSLLVAEAMTTLQAACLQLASMLQRTGFNHSSAECASGPAPMPVQTDTHDYAAWRRLHSSCASVAAVTGGSGDEPLEWNEVADEVGSAWPDGVPHLLRTAATAWSTAGTALADLTATVADACVSIQQQQSPEVQDALVVCTAMEDHLTAVAAACAVLGRATLIYADTLDSLQSDLNSSLQTLAARSAVADAAGLLFSEFTLGASDAAAVVADQVLENAAAESIKKELARFAVDVRALVVEQNAAGTDALGVTEALQPLLAAGLTTAGTALAGVGPVSLEVLATRRLGVAAEIHWAGVVAADQRGGHIQARHVGKSDAYLIARTRPPEKKKRASTFINLAAAESATAQNIAANTEKIEGWMRSSTD